MGGRLPLVATSDFTPEQQQLYERLVRTRIARADDEGYQAALPDGRLIGPFNAFLRAPEIGAAQLEWAQAISAAGLPKNACEVAILTVAAEWDAAYVLYAHTIAAVNAGVSAQGIADVAARTSSSALSAEELLAHQLAVALVRHHEVADDLYARVLNAFGEAGSIALTLLIGQYLATSALVTCFRVPGPETGRRPTHSWMPPSSATAGSDPAPRRRNRCHSPRSKCTKECSRHRNVRPFPTLFTTP